MEPAGYDPRVSKGMALGYIISARGACHLRATFMKAELSGIIAIDAIEGKAAIYVDWEDRFAIQDALIYCRFYRDFSTWQFLAGVVNAAVGTDYTVGRAAGPSADASSPTRTSSTSGAASVASRSACRRGSRTTRSSTRTATSS